MFTIRRPEQREGLGGCRALGVEDGGRVLEKAAGTGGDGVRPKPLLVSIDANKGDFRQWL